MRAPRLPFCSTCPAAQRCAEAPEIVSTDAVQQVAGYVDDFNTYLQEYIDESAEENVELRGQVRRGEEVYDPDENFLVANSAFVDSARETRADILEYLDVLPAGVSEETLMALSQCAHRLADGDCFYTSSMPGYKEQLDNPS